LQPGASALCTAVGATALLAASLWRFAMGRATAKESLVNHKSALVAATLVLAAAGAQARDVYWSIGINAPLQPGVSVGTVFSNAPVYRAAPVVYAEPVYYQAAPVYMPAPVYVRPAPVVYWPQPYYAPQRVAYVNGWARHPGHARGHGHWRDGQRQRGEPVMVRYRDSQR
jgi:hypothetical protein